MLAPAKHRFNVEVYYRMAETGALRPDLVEETIKVYREPHFAGYGSKTILRAGDKASPQGYPDVAVEVAELLKR